MLAINNSESFHLFAFNFIIETCGELYLIQRGWGWAEKEKGRRVMDSKLLIVLNSS